MAFQCTLVTPEQPLLDAMAVQAILPAHDGLIGVLTDRAPLLVKLGTGPLRIDLEGGGKQHYFVDGGVAQMRGNRLTILTSEAIAAAEIDYESARAEYAEAIARRPTDERTRQQREHQLERARAKQAMAGK